MHRTIRRTLTTAGATTAAFAVLTGTALAQDCYLGTPTTNVPKSSTWFAAPISEFAVMMGAVDPECADVAAGNAALRAAGQPLSLRVMERVTVAANAPAHVLSDGKGIDSFHYAAPDGALAVYVEAAEQGCAPA